MTASMRELEGCILANCYRLDRYLDEGAFGAVFRATHLAFGKELRRVAVKVAKRPLSDAEAARTFGDALLMSRVSKDTSDAQLRQSFVILHHADRVPPEQPLAGHPYVVMEYVPGGNVADAIDRQGPFPLTRTRDYFEQVLRAVAFMHGGERRVGHANRAIVHRDLKPANLLLDRRSDCPDVIKVADFGLAVPVETLLGWVERGGTIDYVAPEALTDGLCSPKTDVYALGLIFYEMLTGSNPLAGSGAAIEDDAKRRRVSLDARRNEEFADLDRHVELRQYPRVAQVLRDALDFDHTGRRFENAAQMLAAWRTAWAASKEGQLDPGPATTAQATPWERADRLAREARSILSVHGSVDEAWDLVARAVAIQDSEEVPDERASGLVYLVGTEVSLASGNSDRAGQLARRGYARRKCRSTCTAMRLYYEAKCSPVWTQFEKEARRCPDQS